MAEQATIEPAVTSERAGQYLTFVLAEEEYGLEILKVREIISLMDITTVPQMPDYVKGVINLRGKVVPVVDLRLKVGMPAAERTDQTCIIVVDIGHVEMGILVDRVSEVLDIAPEDIEDTPSFGVQVNTDYILGMGKTEGKVTILLDISKLLSQSDTAGVSSMARRGEASSSTEAAPSAGAESQPQQSGEQCDQQPQEQQAQQ